MKTKLIEVYNKEKVHDLLMNYIKDCRGRNLSIASFARKVKENDKDAPSAAWFRNHYRNLLDNTFKKISDDMIEKQFTRNGYNRELNESL